MVALALDDQLPVSRGDDEPDGIPIVGHELQLSTRSQLLALCRQLQDQHSQPGMAGMKPHRVGDKFKPGYISNEDFRLGLPSQLGVLLKRIGVLLPFKMSSLAEYVECLNCGFVTYSEDPAAPEPRDWDACPDCHSTEFEFTDR